MIEDDRPTTEPPARPTPPDRPPRSRADPAVMRETLDAARRRLGPDDPAGVAAPSAEHQRALLREAAANHAAPLSGSGPSAPPSPPRSDREVEGPPDAVAEPTGSDDAPPVDTEP